jgi:hypothetical protein
VEGNGSLAIASNPWCTVTVDGVERRQTPLNLTLPAGKHTVLLANPEYKIRRQLSISLAPGESVKKKLDFTEYVRRTAAIIVERQLRGAASEQEQRQQSTDHGCGDPDRATLTDPENCVIPSA